MITVLGAANVDIQAIVSGKFIRGDSIPGHISISAGGVARNIAQNLRALAEDVRFITALSSDGNSNIIKKNLTDLGIDFSYSVFIPGGRTSGYVCLLDENGVLVGAVNDMEILESLTPSRIEKSLASLQKNNLLIADTNISGICLAAIAGKAASAGARLVVDTVSTAKCLRALPLLSLLYAIKPNRAEAFVLSGIPVNDTSGARNAARFFHEKGVVFVCISLGKDGAFYSGEDSSGTISVADLPVVNVSGAGDSLTAGFVSALGKGCTVKEAARFGQACASITCAAEKTVAEGLSGEYAQSIADTLSCTNEQRSFL